MPNEEKKLENQNNGDSIKSGYDLLLEKLANMEKKLLEQDKKINDVTAMNRALLDNNSDDVPTPKDTAEKRKKELEEKLWKGLK